MSTKDGSTRGAGGRADAEDRQYETKVVQAIRGTESRAEAKWRREGWELVSQNPGALRTEMTFQRTKPKTFGAYLAQGYTAFRGLKPRTQQVVAASVGGLLLVLVTGGIVAATLGGDDAPDFTATPTASATASTENAAAPSSEEAAAPTHEPAAPATETFQAEEEPSTAATTEDEREPEAEDLEPEPYTYAGPDYETITVDEDVVVSELDQHWVLADSLDASAEDFKDQVKLIITDVAHEEGTANLSISVVTDREIAQAESDISGPAWMDEHGMDHYQAVVVPKMESGYLAWYTGGFDPSTAKLSDADAAFEVIWLPASESPDFENWKPTTGAS